MIFNTEVDQSLLRLETWIKKNGWAGYDPYDIRGQDWYIRAFGYQTTFHRKLRGILSIIEKNLPSIGLRKILNIKKEINPKGMGLLASAYLSLYNTIKDESYLTEAEQILEWLLNNSSKGYKGISWGYPFHWQSRKLLPKGTPSSVVTGIIGDAWLDHFYLTNSDHSLKVALQIAEFFLNSLNRYEKSPDQICFSYTPKDHFKVHNANLFVAAFLARLWDITRNEIYLRTSHNAALYTVLEQNTNGSFYYWGSEAPTVIDHYHTGFVLRHLDTIHSITEAEFLEKPLKSGYEFYKNNLFTKRYIPKHTIEKSYPINIHSCSEALLCMAQLGKKLGRFEYLPALAEFTIRNMQTKEGYFIYEISKKKKKCIPYMRWAQAWMMLALSRLKEVANKLNK